MKRTQILAGVAVAAASVTLLHATAAQVPARGTPTPAAVDWTAANAELLRHFQALVRIDTQDPPGNETKAVEYIKKVLDADGIPVIVAAKDPERANAIARLAGNGSKRPVLIMGHTDTVKVDPSKWKFPPFSATRDGGYVYGRGVLDNKWQVAANIETMLLLKRRAVPLDRDVIFVAQAGEQAATRPGTQHLLQNPRNELDPEDFIAQTGQ